MAPKRDDEHDDPLQDLPALEAFASPPDASAFALPDSTAEDDLPAWLTPPPGREAPADLPREASAAPLAAADALPDWLQSDLAEELSALPAEELTLEPAATDLAAPAWLETSSGAALPEITPLLDGSIAEKLPELAAVADGQLAAVHVESVATNERLAPEPLVPVALPPPEITLTSREAVAEEEPEEVVAPAFAPSIASSRILEELVGALDAESGPADGFEMSADIETAAPGEARTGEQHLLFVLADGEYAVTLASVLEIGRPGQVTPVPNVPDWVAGVTNVRGDILSLLDLRTFLGLEPAAGAHAGRMVVVRTRQQELTTALIVDRVSGIRYLSPERHRPLAAPLGDRVAPYLRGVCDHHGRLLGLLDLDRLLLSPEIRQFEPV